MSTGAARLLDPWTLTTSRSRSSLSDVSVSARSLLTSTLDNLLSGRALLARNTTDERFIIHKPLIQGWMWLQGRASNKYEQAASLFDTHRQLTTAVQPLFVVLFCSDLHLFCRRRPQRTFYLKTAEQKPTDHHTAQQYSDWYTGRWWVGCYIWYSEEGSGRGRRPPRPLLNVTAHPSTRPV